MRSAAATIPRLLSLVAQFITFCGFVVIVAGLAKLQKKTNDLGPAANIPADTVTAYVTTFQGALITPYPTSHGFQFSFIWFIIFLELTVLLLTLMVTLIPGMLHIGRSAALALLAVAFTLVINVVNNLTFLHRNDVAKMVYGKKDINVTFAGALLVAIGNGLTILTLGMWTPATTTNTAYPATTTTAKREADVAV